VLAIGLILIAAGAGGIKPCVSANVGDQFGESNKHLLERVFGWFYFSINLGSSFSIWLCPVLLRDPNWGSALRIRFTGRADVYRDDHLLDGPQENGAHPASRPRLPARPEEQGRSQRSRARLDHLRLHHDFLGALGPEQRRRMDDPMPEDGPAFLRHHFPARAGERRERTFHPRDDSAFQLLAIRRSVRVFPLTPIRKIGIGLFLTAMSFVVIWMIQLSIDHGGTPNVGWQFLAYIILSAGEVMVSITGLEFAYTQAPNRMKSLLMAMWLLSIALGNQIPSIISFLIPKLKSMGMNLEGANYFRFFTYADVRRRRSSTSLSRAITRSAPISSRRQCQKTNA
jgi:POT family proton-dependent oligopeptide transporter